MLVPERVKEVLESVSVGVVLKFWGGGCDFLFTTSSLSSPLFSFHLSRLSFWGGGFEMPKRDGQCVLTSPI